jgi:ketosteroid isomerase-like protein
MVSRKIMMLLPLTREQPDTGGMAMRLPSTFIVGLAACLAMPALAADVDQQARQQIEAVHTRFVEAVNKGDVDALSAVYTPSTVQIDSFGRIIGVNPEFVQAVRKKGVTLNMPVDSVQALKGGQAAMAYGTFTSKFADPNVPPGQGNWIQVFEREGESWKIVAHVSSRAALAAQMK